MNIQIKRIYEAAAKDDGFRVLVDRLWPRGIKKENAGVDLWLKEIAPSTELRKWFGHEPERFKEFESRYQNELQHNPEMEKLRQLKKQHPRITLLYGAKDEQHNQAVVLKKMLQ